jgi:hypothetical protein
VAPASLKRLDHYKQRECYMIRTLSVIAVIGLAATVAVAQQSSIAARKQLMKDNGDQAKIGAAMAKGEAPFDLAKAHKIFDTFEDTAVKAPACSRTTQLSKPPRMIPIPPVQRSGKTWTTSKQGSLSYVPMRRPLPLA